jgi:hypothetical protein
MEFNIIDKNLKRKDFETSILLPIRQDKRAYVLLNSLARQKYKNFVLLIANDSKEPFFKKEDFPKGLNYIYYHTPEEKYTQYEKLNFLINEVKTPYSAITESDCIANENWLSDLIPIVKKDKQPLKGCEVRPLGCCTANLLLPTDILKEVKFDENIAIIGDYEFGMALEKSGHKLTVFTDRGRIYHNLGLGKPQYNRIIPCARDETYVAFKYKDMAFLKKKILRNGYNAFFGISEIFLMVFYYIPYFYLKKLFGKSEDKSEKQPEQ